MTIKKEYRNNGAIGALLDEYQKAIYELTLTIKGLSQNELKLIVDHETTDYDCKSVQTILSHIVQSGYTYVVEIRKWLGEQIDYRDKETLSSAQEYEFALVKMLHFTEALFNDYPEIKLTEFDWDRKIKVRWGQTFDVEQLMQHAIVHVLRHRRQIEIFINRINQTRTKPELH